MKMICWLSHSIYIILEAYKETPNTYLSPSHAEALGIRPSRYIVSAGIDTIIQQSQNLKTNYSN